MTLSGSASNGTAGIVEADQRPDVDPAEVSAARAGGALARTVGTRAVKTAARVASRATRIFGRDKNADGGVDFTGCSRFEVDG